MLLGALIEIRFDRLQVHDYNHFVSGCLEVLLVQLITAK